MADFKNIKALIIDMDGVLWRGGTFLPGVQAFFAMLRQRQLSFVLATNNSTATPEGVVERLATCGTQIFPEEVLTSSMATAAYLQTRLPSAAKIHPVGEDAVRNALQHAGFTLSDQTHGIDAVVIGFDRDITWQKLTSAALAVQHGALFVGTNPDVSFPMEEGQAPGNGAFVKVIEVTTKVKPIIVGKPEPLLYQQAVAQLQLESERTLVIGDRLETDILGAKRAGMTSALVLTGVTSREELENATVKPDWVFDDLPALTSALSGA